MKQDGDRMDQLEEKAACSAYLHRCGLKFTKHRQLVLQLLQAQEGVLTAEEIYSELQAQGADINFSTVYRILESFTQKGVTEKSYLADARKYGFVLHALGHRHRLICLGCHRIVEVEHCPIASFEEQLAGKTDFSIVGHNLEWYGYCASCRKGQEKA